MRKPAFFRFGVLSAGRYLVKFQATALNRHKMKGLPTTGKGTETWQGLRHNKCVLAIYHSGIPKGSRSGTVRHSGGHTRKVLATIEIEDDKLKNYTVEVDLNAPGKIYIEWLNGPYNSRLNRLRFGRAGNQGYTADDYAFPVVRVPSGFAFEKIEDAEPNRYVVDSQQSVYQVQLKQMRSELGLKQRVVASPESATEYWEELKRVLLSPEHLYVEFTPDDIHSATRYISYALLKCPPDASLREAFPSLLAGRLSSGAFAQAIVTHQRFEDYLSVFAKYWLQNQVELSPGFHDFERRVKYREETVAYLKHIFENNRPVREVFYSDYRVVNLPLAEHYGQLDQSYDFYDFAKVDGVGGVMTQPQFYVAHSDGVDPRPFARAKWILSNAFDTQLSELPGNIDNDQFVKSAAEKSFIERTQEHASVARCAQCHHKLDPVAFALLDRDTVGRMQKKESPQQFKDELLGRLQASDRAMAKRFTTRLIAFTIGRETNLHDMQVVEQILAVTSRDNYRTRDILQQIIESYFVPTS